VFGSVVAVVFQSVFLFRNASKYFIFFKIFFILAHQNDLKTQKNILI
jgi:hypothetical protein